MSITTRYQELRRRVPAEVTIVLAAKTRTPAEVCEAIAAGATHIGHNYVQEAEAMVPQLAGPSTRLTWHMIGPLQTNKINKALQLFDVIQTVHSLRQLEALDARASRAGRTLPVYLEINSGREAAKAGLPPEVDAVAPLLQAGAGLASVQIRGLMTMGPFSADPEDCRPGFRLTRQLFERLQPLCPANVALEVLSMGMSDSWQVAIEEGANMIRVGSAVFGPR